MILLLICISTQLLPLDGFYHVLLSKRTLHLNSNDKYYDPFKEDPKLVSQFTSELGNIKTMTILDIKNEIFQIRNITKNEITSLKSIKDRNELECILARERVKLKLKVSERKQDIVNYRQKMVILLKEESDIIERDYTNFKVVQELLQRGIKFDPDLNRKDLILLLALDNLKYLTNHNRSSEPEDSIEITNTFDTANVVTDFIEFADNCSTKFVDALSNISDKIDIPHIIKNFTSSKESNPNNTSSEQYLEAIHGEIKSLSHFDEIVLWSKSQSKSKLTKFLIFSGIEVPQNASHKIISSIFADFVLESRNIKNPFISNSYISGSTINSRKIKTRRNIQDIHSYDKLQLENEIIYEIWNKTISHKFSFSQLNQFITFTLVRVQNLGVRLLHSSLITGSLSSIQLMLALILKILLTLSKWSSGNSFQPSNTLVAVSLFTILTRGGIIKFIGTFIFIKLFRHLSTSIFPMDRGDKKSFT